MYEIFQLTQAPMPTKGVNVPYKVVAGLAQPHSCSISPAGAAHLVEGKGSLVFEDLSRAIEGARVSRCCL